MSEAEGTRSHISSRTIPTLTGGVIRVLDGPDKGQTLSLASEPVVIGSASACELVLTDPGVSRRHLEVSLGKRGFVVRDLGSRNGTVFEGSRVIEIAVPPGAILSLADTHLALGAASTAEALEPSDRLSFGELWGISLPMRKIFALLERAAACDATVLLGGETGTGKELAAHALHTESDRKKGPFEVLDCGAVAPTLLASELFGHVRGSFTGAVADRAGVFERADGGTVFLDEIGELPLSLQPTLLRACDLGEVTRVGDRKARRVNVRIIAATRRDLAEEVLAKRFRDDLYYRLNVLPVTLPPLRERRGDLPLLCTAILRGLGLSDPGSVGGAGLATLQGYRWPGNVRELRNVLEGALARSPGATRFEQLTFDLMTAPQASKDSAPVDRGSFQALKQEAISRFEREFLADLLAQCDGNLRQASRVSGVERMQLKRLLRKHGLI
jgi:DNA-binding NtrC family response regulator